MVKLNLLSMNNAKTPKGESLQVLTGILYLAPAKISGYEVCPRRTEGCTKSCLYTAGMGKFSNVQQARIRRTKMFFEQRDMFLSMLKLDIRILELMAANKGMTAAVRLNGTSDIDWTRFGIMEEFPNVRFYDYTKVLNRLSKPLPTNYSLTFSRSGHNDIECDAAIRMGANVSVVFAISKKSPMPTTWNGAPVFDGDDTDARFLDPKKHVIGLRAKGKAKYDTSGFVVQL
jgi:hypothetical protein